MTNIQTIFNILLAVVVLSVTSGICFALGWNLARKPMTVVLNFKD